MNMYDSLDFICSFKSRRFMQHSQKYLTYVFTRSKNLDRIEKKFICIVLLNKATINHQINKHLS